MLNIYGPSLCSKLSTYLRKYTFETHTHTSARMFFGHYFNVAVAVTFPIVQDILFPMEHGNLVIIEVNFQYIRA